MKPLAFLLLFLPFLTQPSDLQWEMREIKLINANKTINLNVVIADTPKKQAQGLMNVMNMDDDEGALFIFKRPKKAEFWMKETYIPLDILFFDASKRLINIHKNAKPKDESKIRSKAPAKYALEVKAGVYNFAKDVSFSFAR